MADDTTITTIKTTDITSTAPEPEKTLSPAEPPDHDFKTHTPPVKGVEIDDDFATHTPPLKTEPATPEPNK